MTPGGGMIGNENLTERIKREFRESMLLKKALIIRKNLHSENGSFTQSQKEQLQSEIQRIREEMGLNPTDFHDLLDENNHDLGDSEEDVFAKINKRKNVSRETLGSRYCSRKECRHRFELTEVIMKKPTQGRRCIKCGAPTLYLLETTLESAF
jgi:hypothetical protein